ncbi:MAG: S9 family peptidase [Rubrivivax sp.]|nr:MAG: S9 family peptidase [Rubrivivax sp.]
MNISRHWIITLGGLAAAVTLTHAAPPPAEVFFKDPDVREAVLSPTGRRLAVTTGKGMSRVGLVVFDLAPGGKMMRAQQFNDGDVVNVRWVNDERVVFSVSDVVDGSGVASGAPGLFSVKADGSQFRQLVRRRWKPVFSEGRLREDTTLDWYHSVVAIPHSLPDKVNEDVLLVQFDPGEGDSTSLVWLNAATTTTRTVDHRQLSHPTGWMTDTLGQPRIAFTRKEDRVAAHVQKAGSATWTRLYESGLFDRPFSIEGMDSSGALFVSRPEGQHGFNVLSRYDFERGAPEAKPLVSTPGFDFDGHLVTDDAGKTLGVRLTVDGETTVWLDPAMKAFQERTDALFPGAVNRIHCRRCGAPDMVALVRSYSDRDPGSLYIYQAKPSEGQQNWRLVQAVRPDVDPAQMATLELHRVKVRDGLDVPVWVTRQPGAKGPLPAVVLVHGGPWVRQVEWGWHAQAQFLASRGYVVIEPEFRGSTGYGEAHFRAGFRQWGQAMQDDVADALRWAQNAGIASSKACIAGSSYGGYSTLMGLVKDPDLYRCGVAWLAPADLGLYISGSWHVLDDITDIGRKYSLPELVGDPVKDAAMIAANSPVRHAARIKAPVMLAYGERDERVPLTHGKRMRDALQAAGNSPVWVTYANEAHGFTNLQNRLDFARRMEAFLAKHLQP